MSKLVDRIPYHCDEDTVNAVVEIERGSTAKYEYDPVIDAFRLDRCLQTSMSYPSSYGFLPQTVALDGDPVDVLVYNSTPIATGAVVAVRIIGALEMIDQGVEDHKLIAVPVSHVAAHRLSDGVHCLDPHYLRLVENFFAHYKDLENKTVSVGEWIPREQAQEIAEQGYQRWFKGWSSNINI